MPLRHLGFSRSLLAAFMMAWFSIPVATAGPTTMEERAAPVEPSPKLSPEEVVKIQLDALKHNNEPVPDAGIATTFKFASPDNQRVTGPLPRFIKLVHNPMYEDMLEHTAADLSPIKQRGDVAQQIVILTTKSGTRVGYVFELSRQRGGRYDGCWMTDGVIRVELH